MAKRKIWYVPSLRKEENEGISRDVSWLELFFDLFFVVVIARIAHDLANEVTSHGFLVYVASFFPIWWVWIGATYYFERFETKGLDNRVFTFLLMIPVAGMAVFSHHSLTSNFDFFVGSYVFARIMIAFLWGRATYHDKEFRSVGIIFMIGFLIAVSFGFAAVWVESGLKYILFGIALFLDFFAPFFTVKKSKALPKMSRSKLPERFGLFTVIVLGEVLVGIISGISALENPGIHILFGGVLGIFICFGLWWVYFDFVARRPFHDKMILQYAWAYLHMPLVMCIVALGAGLMNIVGNDGHFSDGVRQLVTGSFGGAIITIAIIEIILERHDKEHTHKILSPLIKIICGMISLGIGIFAVHIHTIPLLIVFSLSLLVIMVYGAYMWFNQEI